FPGAFRLRATAQIVSDLVEIDCFEILARPMRWHWFFQKCLQSPQPKLTPPIRIFFNVGDVVNGFFRQPGTGIVLVRDVVGEVTDVAIDIDCFGVSFGFHCRSYLVRAISPSSSRAQSSPRSSSSSASSLRPLRTMRPATITWT